MKGSPVFGIGDRTAEDSRRCQEPGCQGIGLEINHGIDPVIDPESIWESIRDSIRESIWDSIQAGLLQRLNAGADDTFVHSGGPVKQQLLEQIYLPRNTA
jgi:hypothetical protein